MPNEALRTGAATAEPGSAIEYKPVQQTVAAGPHDTTSDLHPTELEYVPWNKKVGTFLVIVVPLVGLIASIVMLWGWGISWIHVVLLLGGYLLTGHGVTVGFHRLFTHKSFETGPVVTSVLGVLGSMSVEGSILKWVATHRMHHQHSDRELDPHSPHHEGDGLLGYIKGIWHSHMGWFFKPDPPGLDKYIKDLKEDRLVVTLSRLFPVWLLLGLAIPGVIAGLVTQSWVGGLLGVLWGGLVRVLLVHHITWSVNSACHLWGATPFNTHDQSRNNPVFGILAMGEGWHNTHHAFPASARHGLSWWQIDTSYMVIKTLEFLGLARNIRLPSPDRIAAKRVNPTR